MISLMMLLPSLPAWAFIFKCYMFLPGFLLSTVSRVTTQYILPSGLVATGDIGMNDEMYAAAVAQVYSWFDAVINSGVWSWVWNIVMAGHQVWIHLTSFMYWLLAVFLFLTVCIQLVHISYFIVGKIYLEPIVELSECIDRLTLQLVPNRFKQYLFLSKF